MSSFRSNDFESPACSPDPHDYKSAVGRDIYEFANNGDFERLATLIDVWKNNDVINWVPPDGKGKTALYVASKRGYADCVKALVQAPGIDTEKGPKGNLYGNKTPFSVAAMMRVYLCNCRFVTPSDRPDRLQ